MNIQQGIRKFDNKIEKNKLTLCESTKNIPNNETSDLIMNNGEEYDDIYAPKNYVLYPSKYKKDIRILYINS